MQGKEEPTLAVSVSKFKWSSDCPHVKFEFSNTLFFLVKSGKQVLIDETEFKGFITFDEFTHQIVFKGNKKTPTGFLRFRLVRILNNKL